MWCLRCRWPDTGGRSKAIEHVKRGDLEALARPQQDELAELKSRNEQLTNQVAELTAQVEQLAGRVDQL